MTHPHAARPDHSFVMPPPTKLHLVILGRLASTTLVAVYLFFPCSFLVPLTSPVLLLGSLRALLLFYIVIFLLYRPWGWRVRAATGVVSREWPSLRGNRFFRFIARSYPWTLRHVGRRPLRAACDLDDGTAANYGRSSHPYLFACYPHGVFPVSWWLAFHDVHACRPLTLTATVQMRIPVFREIMLSAGMLEASPASLETALARGRSVCVLPGGTRELTITEPGPVMHIVRRRNFLRYALLHNVPVVPCLAVGAHDMYGVAKLQWESFRKLVGVPLFIFRGAWDFVSPRHVPVCHLVGDAIEIERRPNADAGEVTEADVDELSARFYNALISMLAAHRRECRAHARVQLEIVD